MSYLLFQFLVGALCLVVGIVILVILDRKYEIGCLLFFIDAIAFFFLYKYITEHWVSVIYNIDSFAALPSEYNIDSFADEQKEYVSFSKSIIYRDSLNNAKCFDIEPGNIYVVNSTSEVAVFYPVAYGDATINDNEIVYISPNSVSVIPKHIDYFFYEPDDISVHKWKSGEVKYVLNSLDHALKK